MLYQFQKHCTIPTLTFFSTQISLISQCSGTSFLFFSPFALLATTSLIHLLCLQFSHSCSGSKFSYTLFRNQILVFQMRPTSRDAGLADKLTCFRSADETMFLIFLEEEETQTGIWAKVEELGQLAPGGKP